MAADVFVLEPEVPGGWGPGTVADTSVHPPVVSRLELVFAGWLGDHLVESFPCHLVSTDLAEALEDAGLRGFALDDVQVTVDDQFRTLDPGSAARLPGWRWLRPGHGPDDDLWVDDLARLHVRRRALDVLRSFPLEHCAVELA